MTVTETSGALLELLAKRERQSATRQSYLSEAAEELGVADDQLLSTVCVAYALLKLDVHVDEISRLLSWQDFERLCAALMRSSGLRVQENVVLTKPRAQIDVVASGPSLILSVDCKHWRKGHSPSSMSKFAQSQLKRSSLLRRRTRDARPIASAILSMSEPEGRFVEGVAVVPVRTLGSFLSSIDSYLGLLDLR